MLDSLISSKPYIPPLHSGKEILGNLVSGKKATPQEIAKTASDFEAVFLGQMLAPMWAGVGEDSYMSGGSAEETYRGMMINEYGKLLSQSGKLGIADSVKREMLLIQEKQA